MAEWMKTEFLAVSNQRKRITMPNQVQFVRRTAAVLMACGLIASLLPGLAVAQEYGATQETRAASATELFVAPGGDDAQKGTHDQPFATIHRAQEAVRAARKARPGEGVTVTLRGGLCQLDRPLVFSAEDSGASPDAPVRYRAAKGEEVVLSGGRTITSSWQPDPDRPGVWKTRVADPDQEEGTAWRFEQLWVNQQRALRARTPNYGQFHQLAGVYGESQWIALAASTPPATMALAQEDEAPWQAREDVVKEFSERNGGFNYEESKVPAFTLPNPLISLDGKPVSDAKTWNVSRRDEILNLFRDHVYGRRPDTPYTIRFKTVKEVTDAFDAAATGRSLEATITIDDRHLTFPFVLFFPNQAPKPSPAVIHINNRYFVSLEKALQEEDPFWPARTLIERGYATASFHTSDVDPDKKDGYADGVRAFFANGQPPKDHDWRSLSAWGWAASRILDYLESISKIDAGRVAVSGHSRGGKTSLWAAAEDLRFAAAYSNNSGCGGAALSRRAFGEIVQRITASFPHWFCPPFSAYAGREAELPIDQHELIALCAPRGVYVASGDEDLWADPRGEYASLVASAPVFALLGKNSITETQMPPINRPRVVGPTGYHVRTGGHGLGMADWNWFLDFTDTLFKARPAHMEGSAPQ
jgi:hypothetical protein